MERKVYVQYGCGQCAPEEWLNFDVSPSLRMQNLPVIGPLIKHKLGQQFEKNVRLGDITKGLKGIKENSADGVFCSHVLEHLSLHDFRTALKNTYKILKPGGRFRLVMPDLEVLVQDYLNDKKAGVEDASIRFIKRTILGLEERPRGYKEVSRYAFGYLRHLWLWDAESTIKELRDAGFTSVRHCEFNDSVDPMFRLVEDKKRFELCVKLEAIK